MDKLFLTILNMSLTGTYVIAAVMVARLLLKRAPKAVSYVLWSVAGFRLLFPFSIESIISLIPFSAQTIPTNIATQPIPQIQSGIPLLNSTVSGFLPAAAPQAGANPLQIWIMVGSIAWLVGVTVMVVYGIVSFLILKRKMKASTLTDGYTYASDNIQSPFVLGILPPRIYLPFGLSEQEKEYILVHERTHIKRLDHIIKYIAFFILCIHWFNPLAWVAFILMGADMEMSCDERVLKEMGEENKRDYSLTLLSLATDRRIIAGSPLAFGEGGIKGRLKNIMRYKHTPKILILAAVLLAIGVGIALVTNRAASTIQYGDAIAMMDESAEGITFLTSEDQYRPDFTEITATLMNFDKDDFTCGNAFQLVQRIGDEWRVVPFAENQAFTEEAWTITRGGTKDYTLTPKMLPTKLGEGFYHIVTDVWYDEADGMRAGLTVWAEFSITKEPTPNSATIQNPEQPSITYTLENATYQDRYMHLSAVMLNPNGTALLSTPMISSYALFSPYYYNITDETLLIYYDMHDLIARFTIIDEDTIELTDSYVPLFADTGARYSISSSFPSVGTEALGKLYLGMPIVEVENVLGIPDGTGSGLFYWMYDDLGSVHFLHDQYNEAIAVSFNLTGCGWNLEGLIHEAVLVRRGVSSIMPHGDFRTENHYTIAIDADIDSVTVQVISLYEDIERNGAYAVNVTNSVLEALEITFTKAVDGYYDMTAMQPLASGPDTYTDADLEMQAARLKEQNYWDAMSHYVGAIPHIGRYGIGHGAAGVSFAATDESVDGCFMIQYFPDSRLSFDPGRMGEQQSVLGSATSPGTADFDANKPAQYVITFEDASKNIPLGADELDILITEDILGIKDTESGKFVMQFDAFIPFDME